MKRILFIVCAGLLAACSGNSGADEKALSDSLKTEVLPKLEGSWVMSDYVNSVDSTLSPHKSWELMKGAVALLIGKSEHVTDSLTAGVNWNDHEGGPFTIFVKAGQERNNLRTNLPNIDGDARGSVDIGTRVTKDNKIILCLYQYDANKKLVAKREFMQIVKKQPDTDLSYAIDHLLNAKLLTGKYEIDSLGKKSSAEFHDDGKLKGFSDYKYFSISSDFMDAYSNMDIISFYKNEDARDGFGFKASGDTLSLFQLDSIHDKGEIAYGKKLCTLVRTGK